MVVDTSHRQQDPGFVRGMFASIAGRYDLANHLLSGGMDFLWRGLAARLITRTSPRRILDLATGTGDLARALRRACPTATVVGADFCLPMLDVARQKEAPQLVQADGLRLPFMDGAFDALTVSFGLRNMASRETALQEMARILRSDGFVLVMDFSLPVWPILLKPYRIYLHHVLPRIAGMLTGNAGAYEYLGESIENFPRGKDMVGLMESCGFHGVAQRLLCFGIASIYTGRRA